MDNIDFTHDIVQSDTVKSQSQYFDNNFGEICKGGKIYEKFELTIEIIF